MGTTPSDQFVMHDPRDDELAEQVKSAAKKAGFSLVGITNETVPASLANLDDWIDNGYAGEMQYIPRRREAYASAENVLPSVRSVIMLGMNYRTDEPDESQPGEMRVSRYAWGEGDYHDILRERMKSVCDLLHESRPGCRTRTIVDTAPLLERDFARRAGLGWFGKNTMLIDKRQGSWFFLCAILTDVDLPANTPHDTDHCGTCTRCLEVCPTDAFPEPGVLDARKCISYLTIELRKQPIPLDLREGIGNWGFGCDLCQDVCPWNRKAPLGESDLFAPRDGLTAFDASEILSLNESQFLLRFKQTPLERPGRAGLLRNAAIVLGNSGEKQFLPVLKATLQDTEPLIRGASAWAIGRLGSHADCEVLQSRLDVEDNAEVRVELEQSLLRLRR